MARWGGLNPALSSWRNGIVARFPRRGTQSDGGYADGAHGSTSQHQPDPDGTVDAFDCDVNFLGNSPESGSGLERRFADALKADFQADPRALLWIHDREIANADISNWRRRYYGGNSPHDKHIHFETRQSRERDGSPWRYPRTDALLREMEDEDDMKIDEFFASVGRAVRNDPEATATDRANRNNFAVAMRFAAGMNYGEQTGENMVHNQLRDIAAKLSDGRDGGAPTTAGTPVQRTS